jgi:hypothetical protein
MSKGGERAPERLRDDQRRVVRGDRHAVGERDPLRDPPDPAVRGDQGDEPGRLTLAGMEVGAAVDVDVAAAVDHQLVEVGVERTQVGVVDQGPVGLLAQQPPLGPGHHQQPPVG